MRCICKHGKKSKKRSGAITPKHMEALNKELAMWITLRAALEQLPTEYRSNGHQLYLEEVKERVLEVCRGILHVAANKNSN